MYAVYRAKRAQTKLAFFLRSAGLGAYQIKIGLSWVSTSEIVVISMSKVAIYFSEKNFVKWLALTMSLQFL